MRFFPSVLLPLTLSILPLQALAQIPTTLPVDAEYEGALLRSGPPYRVAFADSGKVFSGTLKADYVRNGITYSADTVIWFFDNGTVSRGTLKSSLKANDILFEAAFVEFYPTGKVKSGTVKEATIVDNLVIPLRSLLTLDENSRVIKVAPVAPNTVNGYRVLHRTLRGMDFFVSWNPETFQYDLVSAVFAVPQLVARIPTEWTSGSLPVPAEGVAVVVPSGSSVSRFEDGKTWFWTVATPGNFLLNGMNFGQGPVLRVRDMQLLSIQVKQAVTIGTIAYPPGSSVVFDAAGRPAPKGIGN
jgi:hypothetical protein